MSHDGSPSPMYWVFWMVFQNIQTFPGFPGIPGVPVLFQMVSGWSGHTWMQPDVTGGVWTSLGVWTVPGHLVLGKCWLATPVGAGSAKLTAGQGLM